MCTRMSVEKKNGQTRSAYAEADLSRLEVDIQQLEAFEHSNRLSKASPSASYQRRLSIRAAVIIGTAAAAWSFRVEGA